MSYAYNDRYEPARNEAIGAVLVRVSHSKDKSTIVLWTKQGNLHMEAVGECCSSSWFESVETEGKVANAMILSFEEAGGSSEWADDSARKVYFGTIHTTKGRITFELRNESNGYYGGSIVYKWESA